MTNSHFQTLKSHKHLLKKHMYRSHS